MVPVERVNGPGNALPDGPLTRAMIRPPMPDPFECEHEPSTTCRGDLATVPDSYCAELLGTVLAFPGEHTDVRR